MLYFRIAYLCVFLFLVTVYYLYILCQYAFGRNTIYHERMSPYIRRLPLVRAYIDQESKKYEPNLHGENDMCAICMEKFDPEEEQTENNDTIIQLKCSSKHMFHTKCLKYWAEKKDICPMCREPIVQNDSDNKNY